MVIVVTMIINGSAGRVWQRAGRLAIGDGCHSDYQGDRAHRQAGR